MIDFAGIKQRETFIWHKRFFPSLIAGLAVAFITIFFEITASNVVLFASLGASAVIITHKYVHKLNIIRTIVSSYLCSLMVSLFVLWLVQSYSLPFPILVMTAVTGTTILLYLIDAFHPPAVAASLAFILYNSSFWETLSIFLSVIVMLVVIKILTYIFYYKHLTLREFLFEFKKWQDVEWDELQGRIKPKRKKKKKKSDGKKKLNKKLKK